jgi:hypothetical protein
VTKNQSTCAPLKSGRALTPKKVSGLDQLPNAPRHLSIFYHQKRITAQVRMIVVGFLSVICPKLKSKNNMTTLSKILGAVLGGIAFIIIVALVMCIPEWLLWNWLMPQIFGLKTITLLQAVGISMLFGMFFKTTISKTK